MEIQRAPLLIFGKYFLCSAGFMGECHWPVPLWQFNGAQLSACGKGDRDVSRQPLPQGAGSVLVPTLPDGECGMWSCCLLRVSACAPMGQWACLGGRGPLLEMSPGWLAFTCLALLLHRKLPFAVPLLETHSVSEADHTGLLNWHSSPEPHCVF